MQDIKSLLTVPFDLVNYKKFSNNFFNDVESIPLQENDNIPSMFKNTIQSYTIFGNIMILMARELSSFQLKLKSIAMLKKHKEIL